MAHDRPVLDGDDGVALKLEILSDQRTGLGATYRYSGTVMGLSIDFSESVTKYLPPREKVWRTIGKPQLLIIASYEMRAAVEPLSPTSARLTISIVYELPAQRSGGSWACYWLDRIADGACAGCCRTRGVRRSRRGG